MQMIIISPSSVPEVPTRALHPLDTDRQIYTFYSVKILADPSGARVTISRASPPPPPPPPPIR